jgi:hypothetical protein
MLIGRQIADAHQQLDTLTAKVGATEQADPGQNKQRDAVILASLPGIGGSTSPRCWQKLRRPCSGETITPCEPSQASLPSPGAPEKVARSPADTPTTAA